MNDAERLGLWGWYWRAFVAGFGAMCGMIIASVIVGGVCYGAVLALAFASAVPFGTDSSSEMITGPQFYPAPTATSNAPVTYFQPANSTANGDNATFVPVPGPVIVPPSAESNSWYNQPAPSLPPSGGPSVEPPRLEPYPTGEPIRE